jgi:hypothetical protein
MKVYVYELLVHYHRLFPVTDIRGSKSWCGIIFISLSFMLLNTVMEVEKWAAWYAVKLFTLNVTFNGIRPVYCKCVKWVT